MIYMTASSPAPTSSAFTRNTGRRAPGAAEAMVMAAPTSTAFDMTGGRQASAFVRTVPQLGSLPSCIVATAAMSVAIGPMIISSRPYGLRRFAMRQPMNSPQTEVGKKKGSIQSTSEILNCILPYEMGASTIVSAA